MGLILLTGGIVWGFTAIESSVGECGSVFAPAGPRVGHPDPDTYTYTPEPAECATIRDDHRPLVFLVIIAGLTVLGGGLVELRTERAARRKPQWAPPPQPEPARRQGPPGPPPITNPRL
ncbi:hypothetical protein J5Y04_16660 [Kitasatospora sp. RG8]|uniref:hypothetical protein n=1 Tax=Kitasatospora sp. RG8 TaxID=2820815 RepID=UPI001ADF0041|nr:hypothetical protein [Kitasatospora sp. RG8]MBP0451160.1 hypothetical protein [Kitasatospora sp. RG8]